MFKNTTMLEQSLLVLIFADMVQCLFAWLFMNDMSFHRFTMSQKSISLCYVDVIITFSRYIQQFISTYVKTFYHLQPTQRRIFFNKDSGTSLEFVKKAASCLLSVNVEWRHSATHNTKPCLFCDGCAPFLNG